MSDGNKEETFNILPHPAKDNQPGSNPGNLQGDPGSEGGLNASNPSSASGGMPGPHILDSETAQGLEAPKSREELKAEAAKFNS